MSNKLFVSDLDLRLLPNSTEGQDKVYSFISSITYKTLQVPDTYLDYLELQGLQVGLGSLERLFYRNSRVILGYLEIQHFPLCLWDLEGLTVQECQLPL